MILSSSLLLLTKFTNMIQIILKIFWKTQLSYQRGLWVSFETSLKYKRLRGPLDNVSAQQITRQQ